MPRVTNSPARRRRKKRVLKKAKGYYGDRSKQYQQAKRTVTRAEAYSYRDRKVKKREYHQLWIRALMLPAARPESNTAYLLTG